MTRLAALIAVVALAAWFASGAWVRRSQSSSLPALPERASTLAPVWDAIAAADAQARSQPASAAAVGALGKAYQAALLSPLAERVYAVAERLEPADPRWPYYRALLFAERGHHVAAAEALQRVTSLDASHALAWLHLADLRLKDGRSADARSAYRRAAAAPQPQPFMIGGKVARRGLAVSSYAEAGLQRLVQESDGELSGQGRQPPAYVPPADPWLDDVVARSQHPDLLLKHAALAARGGDQAWREFLVRRALAVSPRGFDVLLEAASMLQASGLHSEAFEYLRQAEAVAPDDHHTLVEQGKSLTELGRLDEAEQVLRRAIRVRDAVAEYNLGVVLDRQDRWDEARTHYERALAIDPFHARSLNNLASGLDRRGESDAVLGLYQRALRASPDLAEAHSNLGTALINRRRFSEAIGALEQAIALDPRAADAQNNLGIALAQVGRIVEARRAFEQALQLAPRHANARRNLEALTLTP
ncbi:MAG TPA: tetratricopeptide repeat protein [Vicinamibacterales bacterium]|nr:tetratricopeptide repeat protein [Vicinamibacterales bacterium]